MTQVDFSSIAVILKPYRRDHARPVAAETRLHDLGIDRLDYPMIVLDIEDTFDVHLGYDDELDAAGTVAELMFWIAARLAEKAEERRRSAAQPKPKSAWMSTGADRRS